MKELLETFLTSISPALQTFLQALAGLLALQFSAWLSKTYQIQKANLSQEQQYLLETLVRNGVEAAEQVETENADKMDYAFSYVDTALKHYGLSINSEMIVAQIESAVFSKKK